MSSLIELYLSNNQFTILKDLQILQNQPKLIILDISGNQICRDANYRIYVLYYVSKLRVI